MGQADPILTRLNAGPSVKKLVETALALSNSPDPQQRNHAYSFWETAIKELEDGEKVHEEQMGKHSGDDGLDNHKLHEEHEDDDEHKLHEEELSNNNTGSRTTGSEMSSDNTEPYPGEGKDTTNGEKPMQDMDGTVNQWSETGMPPGMGGMPPNQMQQNGMPPNGGGPGMIMPGLAPDIAQEMGQGFQPPAMDTNQMMRQMQYTVQQEMKNYHSKVIAPMTRLVKQQREAIKSLSQEIRETRTASGSMRLDMDSMKKNASASFRETVTPETPMYNGMPLSGIQPPTTRKKDKLDAARFEISQMDKIIREQNSTMYQ